jgi:hypothetical protein
MSTTDQHEALNVVSLADIHEPPPCCQLAHEQGYRRGYRDGYTYAIWDIGRIVLFNDHIWDQVEQFLQTKLLPWVRRSCQGKGAPVSREGGPRVRLVTHRPTKVVS